MIDEHLCLVFKSSEGGTVDDAITVALILATMVARFYLSMHPAT